MLPYSVQLVNVPLSPVPVVFRHRVRPSPEVLTPAQPRDTIAAGGQPKLKRGRKMKYPGVLISFALASAVLIGCAGG